MTFNLSQKDNHYPVTQLGQDGGKLMITKNDLYDISAALAIIRSNPQYELNVEILDKIIRVLKLDDNDFEDNQIRKAIASIENMDQERWHYAYHNNFYVNHCLLKNKQLYQLLINICTEIKQLLEMQNYERVYDLVDSVHCVPDIIAENNFS
ncbi:MAG: hypothetical protein LBQ48_00685, partial [Oscillospiraceae bacterium]|nr:hypothetical protein [Oscillospiraceae bacterium]